MRCLFFLFFLLGIHHYGLAQTINGVIVDSATAQPIPYANVVLQDKNIGVSASVDGKFEFNLENNTGAIVFSSVGYAEKAINISELKSDTNVIVRLTQKANELEEIVLDYKKVRYSGTKTLGLPKKAKVSTGLPFGNEICGYVKNTYHTKGLLKNVWLDIQKESKADYIAAYNIKFYEYDDNLKKPGKALYNKNLVVIPENKTYKFKVPVDSLDIIFPERGICIGVEIINIKYTGKLKSMSIVGPRINFTHTPMEILSWSRFRNKDWKVDTHKSRVRKDFINFLVGVDVVIEK